MKPLSFDPETAREVTGDEQSRLIEAQARLDADALEFRPPMSVVTTYWGAVKAEMRAIVYKAQYEKRIARNLRKQLALANIK